MSEKKIDLLAPNGKKSNLTTEQYQLVRTPAFLEWFGDWINSPETASKVLDENGEPVICFHGTNRNFTIFRSDVGSANDRGFYGRGFYFTFSTDGKWMPLIKNEAAYYGSNVLSCFIKSINPFDISILSKYKGEDIRAVGYESIVFLSNIAKMFPQLADKIKIEKHTWSSGLNETEFEYVSISVLPDLIEKYSKMLKTFVTTDNMGDKVKSGYVKSEIVNFTDKDGKLHTWESTEDLGRYKIREHDGKQHPSENEIELYLICDAIEKYEGIYAKYHPEGYMTRNPDITEVIKKNHDSIMQSKHGDEIVVFEPTQIKLATAENVTFDGKNPDIRFEKGGNIKSNEKFKKWFSDSKVVDKNGFPLVVYHASNNDFNYFKNESSAYYFAENPNYASNVKFGSIRVLKGQNIMPVYLKANKIKYVDFHINHQNVDRYLNSKEYLDELPNGLFGKDSMSNENVWVVFYPNQIKSAIGNNGNFDGNNPDIIFEKGGYFKSVGMEGFLIGKSRNPYLGKETEIKCFNPNIRCFVSENNEHRFLYYVNNKSISVLQLDENNVIRNMFTLEDYRRKGYADKLFQEAEKHLKNITFSNNLSDDGKLFKYFIESKFKDGGILQSAIEKLVNSKAIQFDYDKFNHWFVQNFILKQGNKLVGSELLVKHDAKNIQELYSKLKKQMGKGGAMESMNDMGGYDYSEYQKETAKKVDLITLPKKIEGTNCFNCIYVTVTDSKKGLGFCANKEIQLPVTERMCCSLWDNSGVSRSWLNDENKNKDMENKVWYNEGGVVIREDLLQRKDTQVETLLSDDVNFDTRKGLNRSDKKVSEDVISKIHDEGMTIEMLEELGLPIYKYKTQITVHGNFDGIEKTRVGLHGYKNLFLNDNKSLGIKYNAIDAEKKKLIMKALRYNNQYNENKSENFRANVDSKGFVLYLRKGFKSKQEMLDAKSEIIDIYNRIPNNFIGKKNIFTYYIPFVGLYVIEIHIDFNAIYEKNVWIFINAITNGFIGSQADLDKYIAIEQAQFDLDEKKRKEAAEIRAAENKIKREEYAKNISYPLAESIPNSDEFAVGYIFIGYEGKPSFKVWYVNKNRGRQLFHEVEYAEISEIPTGMTEPKYSHQSKKDLSKYIRSLDKFIADKKLYVVYAPESKKNNSTMKNESTTASKAATDSIYLEQVESKHTKTNAPLFVVKIVGSLDREAYKKLDARVKELKGYYSSFVKGFIMKDKLSDEQLTKLGEGIVSGAKPVVVVEEIVSTDKPSNVKEAWDAFRKKEEDKEESWHRVFIVHKDNTPVTDFDKLTEEDAKAKFEEYKNLPNSEITTWEKRFKNKFGHVYRQEGKGMYINKTSDVPKKSALETARENYPIVFDTGEGFSEQNVGFNNFDELQAFLEKTNDIPNAGEGYSKNWVYFKGYPSYVRIDISKSIHDFNPKTQHISDYMKSLEEDFDWSVFDAPKPIAVEPEPVVEKQEVVNTLPELQERLELLKEMLAEDSSNESLKDRVELLAEMIKDKKESVVNKYES